MERASQSMASVIDRLSAIAGGRETLGQLVRFGIVGVSSTLVYAAVYVPLVTWIFPGARAVFAVPFAFAVAVAFGFPLHSLWSFRGHGVRGEGATQPAKFVLVQGFGMLLNAAFTWVITGPLHGSTLLPLIPVVTITPIATFALNRHWVFG